MATRENAIELLLSQVQTYPEIELQDLFKFIYQSAFGCEHMLADLDVAMERIRQEAENCRPHTGELVEPLNGTYCRVHLDYLKEGLRAETLGKLFFLSAEHEAEGEANLREMVSLFIELCQNGSLPFSGEEATSAVEVWENSGFAACHHSDRFRAAYAPAYRVIKKEYAMFLPLFAQIDRKRQTDSAVSAAESTYADSTADGRVNNKEDAKNRFILSIEGRSASGKTTLAKLLEQLYGCTVFHMDDFFLRPEQRTKERFSEPGGNVDRERFLEEVLVGLKKSQQLSYRPFDCGSQRLLPSVSVTPGNFCVVEGAYSMHPDLAGYYDFSVYLDISAEEQKKRILKRNTPEMAERFFSTWIPQEETYFKAFSIKNNCNIVISAENTTSHHRVSDKTIENVAILAKLSLSEEQKQQAKKDMGEMLSLIDKLNELDTSGVEPMSHIFPQNSVFREDVLSNGDGSTDTLLNAPAKKDGGILVPRTLT